MTHVPDFLLLGPGRLEAAADDLEPLLVLARRHEVLHAGLHPAVRVREESMRIKGKLKKKIVFSFAENAAPSNMPRTVFPARRAGPSAGTRRRTRAGTPRPPPPSGSGRLRGPTPP